MSSGVAMNRKIQRESQVDTSQHNTGSHPRVGLRQANATPKLKQLKGTAAQKNWYLLRAHEQRLNRLEAWVQEIGLKMQMGGNMSTENGSPPRQSSRRKGKTNVSKESSSNSKNEGTVQLEVNEE